mmetsp:Transcript_23419/g.54071  ORF Transcript_23419/g.54071 Transcript_23419/m.54071 type:complete len:593 (-) Transcript_23419:33-1811(-)
MSTMLKRIETYRSKECAERIARDFPDAEETLKKIADFFQKKETHVSNDASHQVCQDKGDWWCTAKSSKKLAIAEENQKNTLAEYIAELYNMGIPLALEEVRSPEMRLFQDVVIRGVPEDPIDSDSHPLLRSIGEVVGELFGPFLTFRDEDSDDKKLFLDAVLLDGSGKNPETGFPVTHLRFVWSTVIVNQEHLIAVRDYQVNRVKQDEALNSFLDAVEKLHEDNKPSSIFPDRLCIRQGRIAVQMPLNDRITKPPLKSFEDCPMRPRCVKRFHFEDGGKFHRVSTRQVQSEKEMEEWVQEGSIRQGEGTKLSEFKPPQATRARDGQAATRASGGGTAREQVQQTRTGGRVSVRSVGGSPGDDVHRRGPRDPNKAVHAALQTAEREFHGTGTEFSEVLRQNLSEAVTVEEGKVTWTGQEGQTVIFNEATKKVYIQGKDMQLRFMVDKLQKHLVTSGEMARSVVSGRTATARTNARTAVTQSRASYARSEVLGGPQAARSVAASTAAASVASQLQAGVGKATENTRRTVIDAFQSQAEGELDLAVGDVVLITTDPPEERHNKHRWVCGKLEGKDDFGWFPLSHTEVITETAGDE